VVLPNGQIFATGGAPKYRGEGSTRLWAGIYTASTNTWSMQAQPTGPRTYHSTARVRLDGSVQTFGGNGGDIPENRIEEYRPWYTFVPRPAVIDAPVEVRYDQPFPVAYTAPPGASVTKVTLTSATATTHQSGPNNSQLQLPHSRYPVTGGLVVRSPRPPSKIPADAVPATPGWYKLSVVTTGNVPSPQAWLHLI